VCAKVSCCESAGQSSLAKGYVAERKGYVMPYSEMDNSTVALLPLISERARKESKLQYTSTRP